MQIKKCDKCSKEVEIAEIGDVLVVSPEDEEQLTAEKLQEEAEDRDRNIYEKDMQKM